MTSPSNGVPCTLMRGGTSKGAYFLASDLPPSPDERDDLLLRLLGSPDAAQIDGIGGGHPLTSKVAVVSASSDPGADIDYLFLQVHVDEPVVSAGQPCGNILAGVGPFAVDRGLLAGRDPRTSARIRMLNTGALADVVFETPAGRVSYDGQVTTAGVPFPAAPIRIAFADSEGAVCGSLLPTGNVCDTIDGLRVTCIDNGMPVVIVSATNVSVTGHESCAELEGNETLHRRVEQLRLAAGWSMGLGDVRDLTVPKVAIISAARNGGTLATRMFIPHRCHTSIGVLAAVSVATAALLEGSVAAGLTQPITGSHLRLEHPSGLFDLDIRRDSSGRVDQVAVLRTARKLFDGTAWPRSAAG